MNSDPYAHVAFGGVWSDADRETDSVESALAVLRRAVERTFDEDVRGAELDAALSFLGGRGDRTSQFTRDFRRGLAIENAEDRETELAHMFARIRERFGFGDETET